MSALLRDTLFGQIVRLLTSKRFLKYDEELDPALCLRYADKVTDIQSAAIVDLAMSERNITRLGVPASAAQSQMSDLKDSQASSPTPASIEKAETGTEADRNLIDWYGPNDPANPTNWSTTKKFFVTFQICLLTVSIYSGSSIYASAVESVAKSFNVSIVAAILGLTLFVLGYSIGPMFWSSMFEVPYIGRTPVYIGTLAVFVALQAPTAKASSFGMLMAFRSLIGFFGSPVLATGGATCADMYTPAKRTYAISIWGIAAICGPALGPVIGGLMTQYGTLNGTFKASWQWPIYTLIGFCLIVLFFCLPETSASNILFNRAQRLRRITGNAKLMSKPEIEANEMSTKDIINMCFIHPFTMNITEPMVLFLNLYIALLYGILYIWFESFPIVFMGMHGFSLGQLGLTYLGIPAGGIVIVPPFFSWFHKYLEPKFDEHGELCPEERLTPCFVGAFMIPM